MTREEAIEQLQNCKDLIKQDGQDYLDERDFPLLDMAIKALKSDRPTGEWIYAKEQLEIVPMWECSCCRIRAAKKFNFCPHCGADMRGEQDE